MAVTFLKWLGLLQLVLFLDFTTGSRSTVDYSLRDIYCDQPLFVNFVERTPEMELLDNYCLTAFPLPDDPDTYMLYFTKVYCDGSYEIASHIATQSGVGKITRNSIYHTVRDNVLDYAGCDTYIFLTENIFGDFPPTLIFGLSPSCRPLGLSCLRKVEEILSSRGLPEKEFYVLPMKLPNRCVNQQLCVLPPNPFFNKLPSVPRVL